MFRTLIEVDPTRPVTEQPVPLHNRWHPDIPAVVKVKPGANFRVECMEWTGGQIANDDDASDIRDVDLTRVHYLSGPIAVEGAEPGDLLVVDIVDIGPHPKAAWGFTGIFARKNGGCFLTDEFPDARKACWDFHGIYAVSRHIPGVRFAGLIHPGLIGTAPSRELLERWNRREQQLIDTDPQRVPPLANPPFSDTALAGKAQGQAAEKVAREGARTVPPRENGGNCDIKNLTRGTRLYLPVFVPGANLSLGDLHFSQGDGEITFCGGIEMAGWVDLHVDVIKDGMSRYGTGESPIFQTSPLEPRYSEHLVFEGISVEKDGTQRYLDANVAYRNACLQAIEYFSRFGWSRDQIYLLLGAAPVEGRISGIVDIPNSCCTLYVPTGIFDIDVRPGADGPKVVQRGTPPIAP